MSVRPAGRPGPRGAAEHAFRRRRLIEVTLELAADGGYDAVLMKTVADRAGVAIATLYRYFPSKVHLLVHGLGLELSRLEASLAGTPLPGDTPAERVLAVLDRLTTALRRYPRLSEAMTRALMFADESASDEVETVVTVMQSMLSRAMRGTPDGPDAAAPAATWSWPDGGPADAARTAGVVRVLGDVWLAAMVSVVTDRATVEEMRARLELAVRLLLDHPSATTPVPTRTAFG